MYGFCVLFSSVVSLRSVRYNSSSSKKLLDILSTMPKATSGRIAEAQKQRQYISKKSEKYGPSTVYLQVLGSGARGVPNTLYLFTDQKRYLFNCGECTQRLAHEHKVKLSKLEHIFITRKTWSNIGGLPGLSLTLQDVGVPKLTLHGPEGLDELYNATKRFVIMKDMSVTMANCSSSEEFDDSVMSVKYVHLCPNIPPKSPPPVKKMRPDGKVDKEFQEFINDETDYYTRADSEGRTRTKDQKLKPFVTDFQKKKAEKEKALAKMQKADYAVAYICTLKKRLGTLDLAKCVERGVKPGPLLGQLKNGKNVVLEDGTLVLSKDVKTPDDPGPVFIVLDVPDISYLRDTDFIPHFDNRKNPKENIPTLIVHYTPPHVFNTPAYKSFMENFGPTTRHLVLNSQNTCLGSEAVHRTQHKLHLIDPDIFPLLKDSSVPALWNASEPKPTSPDKLKRMEELKNKIALAQFKNIISLESSTKEGPTEDEQSKLEVMAGRTLTMFHLRPKKEIDRSAEPKLHIQDYIQETMDADGFLPSLDQFRHLVDDIRFKKTDAREFPKIVFLGTGSCIPSKTRNTSAIVLRVDENRSILLDCGEGTFGQLVRFYGPKKVNGFLRTLKAIYISHLHADHHIGLIGVLQAHREALEQSEEPPIPLYLLAPGQIMSWLTMYDQQFDKIKHTFTLIPNQNLLDDNPNSELTSAAKSCLAAIGALDVQTCLVAHCPSAFGLALLLRADCKLTYSGDTLPCDQLVKIGKNSTLLIHEATMEDELAAEARMKMHSTMSQAIDIGEQMNAKYTVLTHFSQRYARLPRLSASVLSDNKKVGIAFDNMQVTLSELELLPHMYGPLQLMFAEHCVELELKAAQRQRQRQRSLCDEPPAAAKRYRNHAPDAKQERNYSTCSNVSSRPGSPGDSRMRCKLPERYSVRAIYRESNSSRLRQMARGMPVPGSVWDSQNILLSHNTNSPSRVRKRTSDGSRKLPRPVPISTVVRTNSSEQQSILKGKMKAVTEKCSENQEELNGNTLAEQLKIKNEQNKERNVLPEQRPITAGFVVDTTSRTLAAAAPCTAAAVDPATTKKTPSHPQPVRSTRLTASKLPVRRSSLSPSQTASKLPVKTSVGARSAGQTPSPPRNREGPTRISRYMYLRRDSSQASSRSSSISPTTARKPTNGKPVAGLHSYAFGRQTEYS